MARVFIGRLSEKASERDVEKFFKGYGKIKDIRLKTGYGFIEFENDRDADDAIHDLHHKELAGGRVVLELARSGRRSPKRFDSGRRYAGNAPVRTDYRLLVENLPTRVSWQDLKDLMRKYGEVMFADAHKRRQNEGIVEFKTRSDMKAALKKFDGYEISGRKLRVFEDSVKGKSISRKSRSRSSRSISRSRRGRKISARRSSSPRRKSSRRSTSRSRSKSYSRKRSASRSRTPKKERKPSFSRSRSPVKSTTPLKNGTDSRERSLSLIKRSLSKDKSRSIESDNHANGHKSMHEKGGSKQSQGRDNSLSKERSLSGSRGRSRSRSASNDSN